MSANSGSSRTAKNSADTGTSANGKTPANGGHNGGAPKSGTRKAKAKTTPKKSPTRKTKAQTTKRTTKASTKAAKPSTARKATSKAGSSAGKAGNAGKTAGKARKAAKAGKAITKVAPKGMARKFALMALKKTAGKAAEAGMEAIRNAVDRAAGVGNGTVGTAIETVTDHPVEKLAHKRLPIQRSVDIAVPLRVTWEEFLKLECLPEGAHGITDIERDGAILTGYTTGARSSAWEAEILDERPEQSFAWQSHKGSDCAGLITFHSLSERLTRVELNLDVVPKSVIEAAQLTTRQADRRAEAELRRFKARLELINPDLYEQAAPAPEEEDEDEPTGEPDEENETVTDAQAEEPSDTEEEETQADAA